MDCFSLASYHVNVTVPFSMKHSLIYFFLFFLYLFIYFFFFFFFFLIWTLKFRKCKGTFLMTRLFDVGLAYLYIYIFFFSFIVIAMFIMFVYFSVVKTNKDLIKGAIATQVC